MQIYHTPYSSSLRQENSSYQVRRRTKRHFAQERAIQCRVNQRCANANMDRMAGGVKANLKFAISRKQVSMPFLSFCKQGAIVKQYYT